MGSILLRIILCSVQHMVVSCHVASCRAQAWSVLFTSTEVVLGSAIAFGHKKLGPLVFPRTASLSPGYQNMGLVMSLNTRSSNLKFLYPVPRKMPVA